MDICDELQKNMESSQLDGFINGRNLLNSIIQKVLEDPYFERNNILNDSEKSEETINVIVITPAQQKL